MTLSDKLKDARIKKGLSQIEVAKLINIGNKTVSDYERGISSPDPDTLKKLAKLYNVSTDYLLDMNNSQFSNKTNDIQLDDFQFALYGEVKDLTEEQKQTLLNMAKFLKDSNNGK